MWIVAFCTLTPLLPTFSIPCRKYRRYGTADGWEVLWGYDQEVAMGQRAGQALQADIQAMEVERIAETASSRQ